MSGHAANIGVGEALDLLGLGPSADQEALRRAFNAAVKAAHPDRPGGDHERLRLVIEAYQLLKPRPLAPDPAPESAHEPPRRAEPSDQASGETGAETPAAAKLRRFAAAWAAWAA